MKFQDLVGEIKRACRWTDQALQEASLKRVLEWTGCSRNEIDMYDAWQEFLNLYYEADQESLDSHDSSLKTILRRFARQSVYLTSFVLGAPRNTTFLAPDGSGGHIVVSHHCDALEEADHVRLMCLVHQGLENWTHLFGCRDPLRSQAGFGYLEGKDRSQAREESNSKRQSDERARGGRRGRFNRDGKKMRNLGHEESGTNGAPHGKQGKPHGQQQQQQLNASENNQKGPVRGHRVNALKPARTRNSSSLFSTDYLREGTASFGDTSATVIFDSGNDAATIFPSRLLPFSDDAKPVEMEIPCAGNVNNFLRVTHTGSLTFTAPKDDGGTEKITLEGCFAD